MAHLGELWRRLVSSNEFMPHGHCYLWRPELVWLHVVSDAFIGVAYIAISLTLLQFVRRRRDLPFPWLFSCFGVFIVACGATHFMEIWTLWTPNYWLAGGIKALTALASVGTAYLLILIVPKALLLPSPAELRATNEALVDANQAKNDFLAAMSHELRTPLNSILGFSEILIDGRAGELNEQQVKFLKNVCSSGSHLLTLINELLDLSKVEAGHVDLRLERHSPVNLAASAIATVKPQAAAKNIALELNAPPAVSLPSVMVDTTRYNQALYNLLSNAIKFTPPDGKVVVQCEVIEDGTFVRTTVRDSGPGIHESDIPLLFRPFAKLSHRARSEQPSTGLGLAVTRRVVLLMGGRIGVDSEFGSGASFNIDLPINTTQASAAPTA